MKGEEDGKVNVYSKNYGTAGYEPERLCHIYLFIYDIMFNYKNKKNRMMVTMGER